MAEHIRTRYRRLFEIHLLHHYWLDEGATVFDLMTEQKKKDERLLYYDMRPFLEITPAFSTKRALEGLRCIYRNTALGCVVAVPEDKVIPDTANFNFIVTVRGSAFYNYTALTLRPQNIYELYYQPEDKIYRYKENVPLLSNLTGAQRPDPVKALFLSREYPSLSSDDKVESLYLAGNALRQLAGDQPNGGSKLDARASNLPVYLHQGDVPAIVPPDGLSGAPARGIELSEDIPDDTFAIIRLGALRKDDGDFSFIDDNGLAKKQCPVYQVRFKNRSTVWKYLRKDTGELDSAETRSLPLTYYGNAGKKRKPSAGLVKAEKSGHRITQLFSEIFV